MLWLILAFFNAAGLMLLLGAEFIAMLLVIVYVGAVAVLLAILGALPPVLFYWFVVGRVPSVTPEDAKTILAEPKTDAVLVDVRTPEEFAAVLKSDLVRWGKVVKASGARVD